MRLIRRPLVALLVLAAVPVTLATRTDHRAVLARGAGEDVERTLLAPVAPGFDVAFHERPELRGLPLGGSAYDSVRVRYDAAAEVVDGADERRVDATESIALLSAGLALSRAELTTATAARDRAQQRYDEITGSIGELATDLFIDGGQTSTLDVVTDPKLANQRAVHGELGDASLDTLVVERERAEAELEAATDRTDRVRRATTQRSQDLADAKARVDVSLTEARGGLAGLAAARASLEDARPLGLVDGTDINLVALDAYYRAADQMGQVDPSCEVKWWALAGISRVEGRHGTYGSSLPDRFGTVSPKIIGIALIGDDRTTYIRDTDDGELDGDTTFDRAVGPMQFIPETWRRFAHDGNDDDQTDPQNLYDATLTTGYYLCRASHGLTNDGALRVAYFAYNHLESYVDNVLANARRYERDLALPEPGEDPLNQP